MHVKKWVVGLTVLLLVTGFFVFDLGRFLSLDYLKQSHIVQRAY